MPFEFKMGVVATSFLLVQVHMAVLVLLFVLAGYFESIGLVFNILAFVYLCIMFLGHARASWASFKEMDDSNLLDKPIKEPETLKEALNVFRNPVILGLKWRVKNEWEYMKRIANFNFK